MKIDQEHVGTVEILTPAGALVDDDAQEFCNLLLERVRDQSPRLVISMQEVSYMDSVTLEGLLEAADLMAARAFSVKLVGVTSTCREILDLTGLAGRFRFFEEVQDAVRSFL